MRKNVRASVFGGFVCLLLLTSSVGRATAQAADGKVGTGSVSGVVVKNGEPAAGVGILITEATLGPAGPGKKTSRSQSDKEGRFVFDGLERGSYNIDVYMPGAFVRSASPWSGPMLVTVGEGEAVTGVKIELEPGGVITGRVVDAEGKPVAGEAIQLYLERTRDGGAATTERFPMNSETDDRGIYRIFGLSPGRYAVGAGDQRQGFGAGAYELGFYGGATTLDAAKRIAVESGTEVREVDLTLRRAASGFTIVGKVLDAETRKPIPDVGIFCGPLQGGRMIGFSGGSGVREDGEFSVEGKISGTYGIIATMSDAEAGSYSCEPVEVVVTDRDVTGVVVEMRRAASLRGVIVPVETEPGLDLSTIRTNSIVVERRSEPGEDRRFMFGSAQLRIQPDLSFRATGMRPGSYTISFTSFSPVKGFYVTRVEVGGAPVSGPIQITEMVEIGGVRIVVGRANAVLRGRVVLHNGTFPFERTFVLLRVPGTRRTSVYARVDAKGAFQIESAPPGEFEAVAIANSDGDASIESKPVAVSIGTEGTVELTIDLDLKPTPPTSEAAP